MSDPQAPPAAEPVIQHADEPDTVRSTVLRPGLRVGLTGSLGSGKSTVAAMLAARGAYTLSADELGRQLMQPGTAVFNAIAGHFGPSVVGKDGLLDRPELARLAFTEGRVEELNAIVHPATIALQAARTGEILARDPAAIVVVESALILETSAKAETSATAETSAKAENSANAETESREAGVPAHPRPAPRPPAWRHRFDRLVLVTAAEDLKIARFVARSRAATESQPALRDEARRRLARQLPDSEKAPLCDFILDNNGSLSDLELAVDHLWDLLTLHRAPRTSAASLSNL